MSTIIKQNLILTIDVDSFSPITGFVHWECEKMNKLKLVICCAGGPMMSLILTAVLFFYSAIVDASSTRQILKFSGYYFFYQFLITAIPGTYPSYWGNYAGTTSDGYKVWKLIKEWKSA